MLLKVKRENGKGKAAFENIIHGLGDYEGKLGWDASAIYPNGTKVAQVAAIQEFGDPAHNIPSRSFMRSTIMKKTAEWKDKAFKLSKSVMNGGRDAKDAFSLLVQSAEGDIAETITTLQEPALKEATIKARMAKRSDQSTVGNLTKPLVDTGHMLATLTSTIS